MIGERGITGQTSVRLGRGSAESETTLTIDEARQFIQDVQLVLEQLAADEGG